MLKRSPLSLIGDLENLHYQAFAHEMLCGIKIGGHSALNELRRD
jgi:hypothetical protein